MAKLGFIGLGVMGGNMVARLLEKGHTVTGYNRTRSKAQWLIDKGMKFADSPKAVAAASDVTFTMVTNAAALAAVTDGPDGLLAGISPGKYHIDMSTVSPEVSRALAAKIREKGADMVDAPVSGSVITLQQGKLSVMVGGRKETFEHLKTCASGHRSEGHLRRRQRRGASDEDRVEPAIGGADAGFFRRRSAGGEERDCARNCRRCNDPQRNRLADGRLSRPICAAATASSVVRREHDAKGHAAGDGVGPQAQRASADHGRQQRISNRRARHGLGEAGFRSGIRRSGAHVGSSEIEVQS